MLYYEVIFIDAIKNSSFMIKMINYSDSQSIYRKFSQILFSRKISQKYIFSKNLEKKILFSELF